jgi:hypothetical protein
MPVKPVNKVVDPKRIRRAEEEERHKGSLTPQKLIIRHANFGTKIMGIKICTCRINYTPKNCVYY